MALRHGVQYASLATKSCPMHDPVCAAKVAEHVARFYSPGFDAAALLEERCGRFQRGAHAGQLRGWAKITICTEGGWLRHGSGERNGRVVYPGTVLGVEISDFNGKVYLAVGEAR